jgi:pilus assembly protein CpaB
MRRSRLPLVLALVAFGLTLVSGGYAYNRLLRTVPVLVAAHDIAAGTEMTPDLVKVTRIPAGGRTPEALYGPGQVAGQYAAVPLFGGEPLTFRHITSRPPAKDPLAQLAPGQRVVSVPVKPEAVLGGILLPGDTVDVAAAYPPPDGKPALVDVLATGVQVIDLRNAAALSTQRAKTDSNNAQDGAVPTSVLLLVSTQQAKALAGAVESKATIYLWLVGRDRK